MRHYEIVFLVHPDQSEQVPSMVERYQTMVTTDGGTVHRFEDWGRRPLAYPIDTLHKAHYILMNIECDDKILKDLRNAFQFTDAIVRHLILSRKNAISEVSSLLKRERAMKERETKDAGFREVRAS